MAVEGLKAHSEYPVLKFNDLPYRMTDEDLIRSIIKRIHPKRKLIAGNQIKIYFKKITSHPGMKSLYIDLIKMLVNYEQEKDDMK
ncbi:MAG: hypothetical protein ACW98A_09040 [Candidatus Hodarchaeales archaeon]|jgi:hypothetical protein